MNIRCKEISVPARLDPRIPALCLANIKIFWIEASRLWCWPVVFFLEEGSWLKLDCVSIFVQTIFPLWHILNLFQCPLRLVPFLRFLAVLVFKLLLLLVIA